MRAVRLHNNRKYSKHALNTGFKRKFVNKSKKSSCRFLLHRATFRDDFSRWVPFEIHFNNYFCIQVLYKVVLLYAKRSDCVCVCSQRSRSRDLLLDRYLFSAAAFIVDDNDELHSKSKQTKTTRMIYWTIQWKMGSLLLAFSALFEHSMKWWTNERTKKHVPKANKQCNSLFFTYRHVLSALPTTNDCVLILK